MFSSLLGPVFQTGLGHVFEPQSFRGFILFSILADRFLSVHIPPGLYSKMQSHTQSPMDHLPRLIIPTHAFFFFCKLLTFIYLYSNGRLLCFQSLHSFFFSFLPIKALLLLLFVFIEWTLTKVHEEMLRIILMSKILIITNLKVSNRIYSHVRFLKTFSM